MLAIHIALATGHLSGKAQVAARVEAQLPVQQILASSGRMLRMKASEPCELGPARGREWVRKRAAARRASGLVWKPTML